MGQEISLPYLKQPITAAYPESSKFSTHTQMYSFKNNFNIIPSMYGAWGSVVVKALRY